ncbi:hypothetical protein QE429_004579 [Bacillus sp. SORGH_AS 510]|uniref:hypothetical protein n=1 Tax=Bacillus sp. SORGH_AS_0510 TaxID=3041771 RepID=UPI002786CE47|nr:hypothetical protein [Bacillus sp. SORGH_AS_0510]MDQ1147752.1 hypothetical protein [Bacillus sp. SORGH_AS_0510]
MTKIIKLLFVTVLMSFATSFASSAKADYHAGTRPFYGVKYDSSVTGTNFTYNGVTYRYRDMYDKARAEWEYYGISLGRTEHSFADIYYVGSTSDPSLLGRVFPVNGYGDNVSMDSNWTYVRVYIYHNVMTSFKMSDKERFSNATHEVGHTVKMKHPVSYTGSSVMKQGIQSIGTTAWDINELGKKW